MAKVDVGDAAPDFELPGTGGRPTGSPTTAAASVILAFYPGDFTPVCTKQFCSYRDEGEPLDALGAECSGSRRSRSTRTSAWSRSSELNVPLLADEDLAVADATGSPAGRAARRFTELKDAPAAASCSARSSSSTARGSSATATSRAPGAATRTSATSSGPSPRSLMPARAGAVRGRRPAPALRGESGGGGAAGRPLPRDHRDPALRRPRLEGAGAGRATGRLLRRARPRRVRPGPGRARVMDTRELVADLERVRRRRGGGGAASSSPATRWAPTRRSLTRCASRAAGRPGRDRAGLRAATSTPEALAYWDGLADGARDGRGRRLRRPTSTATRRSTRPGATRCCASPASGCSRTGTPGAGRGAARGAALAALRVAGGARARSTCRRWSSPATTTPTPATPTRSRRPMPTRCRKPTLVSEEEGESPLAWQGGKLSREIAAFCAEPLSPSP